MKNKYKCTYCTNTTCTVSIEAPYDVVPPPECIAHSGEIAEWVVVEADEQLNRIKYLEESNTAMESVLTRIAGEFGTPLGDVFTLMGTIHEVKNQNKKWAKVLGLEG